MRRRNVVMLAALLMLPQGVQHAEAGPFGGMFKSRAKRHARNKARNQARKAVMDATGLDPNVAAALKGDPQGAMKAKAIAAAQKAVGGDLAPFVGKSKGEIKAMLKDNVYEEQGITRFSKRQEKMRADAMVKKRLKSVLKGVAAMPGDDVIAAAASAAIEGDSAGDAAMSAVEEKVEEVVAPPPPPQPLPPRMNRFVGKSKRDIKKIIEREVYKEKGITRFSTRGDKVKANAWVQKRVREALKALDAAGK